MLVEYSTHVPRKANEPSAYDHRIAYQSDAATLSGLTKRQMHQHLREKHADHHNAIPAAGPAALYAVHLANKPRARAASIAANQATGRMHGT